MVRISAAKTHGAFHNGRSVKPIVDGCAWLMPAAEINEVFLEFFATKFFTQLIAVQMFQQLNQCSGFPSEPFTLYVVIRQQMIRPQPPGRDGLLGLETGRPLQLVFQTWNSGSLHTQSGLQVQYVEFFIQ